MGDRDIVLRAVLSASAAIRVDDAVIGSSRTAPAAFRHGENTYGAGRQGCKLAGIGDVVLPAIATITARLAGRSQNVATAAIPAGAADAPAGQRGRIRRVFSHRNRGAREDR